MAFLSFIRNFNFEAIDEYPVITKISTIHKVKVIIANCIHNDSFGFKNWGMKATKKTVAFGLVRFIKVAVIKACDTLNLYSVTVRRGV